MSTNKCIKKLLRLKELFVTSFHFQPSTNTFHLWVKPYKNGRFCPVCNRRCRLVHTTAECREWREPPVYGWIVKLWYKPREILCPKHGRIQEKIPWADEYARITYRFEYAMLVFCQIMTQKAAATVLKIAPSTLSDLLHRAIQRIREGHKIHGLKAIGIDEVAYRKGHSYATVVYDLDRSSVIWVGKGKGRETIDLFFEKELSEEQRKQIVWACCDMSETYIGAIEDHCPNATLVLDRFHIAKALNGAVDEVRKEEWRNAPADKRKSLKGMRWLLFLHYSNRTKKDTRTINALRKGNRRIHRAWVLKDEFDHFWDYKARWAAERFLKRWETTALKSRLEPIRKFVKTLRKHRHRILPYIDSGLTNAVSEGVNRIIKIVKNRASGFHNLQAFTDIIFLTVGDVDIPGQIPASFQAL